MKLLLLVMIAVMTMTGCGGSSSGTPAPEVSPEPPASQDQQPGTVTPELPASQDTPAPETPAPEITPRTVTLNNGITMPVLGIGTYRLSQSQAENSVYWHCARASGSSTQPEFTATKKESVAE